MGDEMGEVSLGYAMQVQVALLVCVYEEERASCARRRWCRNDR